MTPYYIDEKADITLYCGDCRDVLPTLGPVDLVLTDPQYGTSRPLSRGRCGRVRAGSLQQLHLLGLRRGRLEAEDFLGETMGGNLAVMLLDLDADSAAA